MAKWKYERYQLEEPALCEADSVKALRIKEVCEEKTIYAVRSPKRTQDYALCKVHRKALKELDLL